MAVIELNLTDQLPDVVAKQNSNNLYIANNVAYAQHSAGLVGEIKQFAGATAPTGTLLCNGAAYSRTGPQAALFAAIGTTWGVGDGSTTFNLPKLNGQTLIGAGLATSGTTYTLGATVGEEKHLLATTELPAHNHPEVFPTINVGGTALTNGLGINGGPTTPPPVFYTNSGSAYTNPPTTINTGNAGGGGAHNNMQPSAVVNYIIVY